VKDAENVAGDSISAVMSKLSTNAEPDQTKSPTIGVDPVAVVNLTVTVALPFKAEKISPTE
jgi:hypothetical protein